ncbi:MAG: hypothetical protein RBT74_12560 [Tenuifilaceae bacterium]|jgi:hypothetical protein|nr:hypothetical protein [Tenuifilaceae bacterium]
MKTYFSTTLIMLFTAFGSFSQGIFDSLTSETLNEESKAKLEFSGFARGVAYGGARDFDYTNVFGEFALKAKLDKKNTVLVADVRLREGIFFDNRELQLQLKEAYAGYKSERIDLFLGNQIVSWGRTDGFNPTNNITPNDYFFLTYEPDDQKLSNFMLRTKIKPTNSLDIEMIAIPFFRPSVYRYDLFQSDQPASFASVATPALQFDKGALAIRANVETSALGASLSYFVGHNPFYGFSLVNFTLNPLGVEYQPTPYFMQSIGADFAIPVKSWIVRGEVALNLTDDYDMEMHIPNPDFSYVLGVERNFWEITTIFQYIGKYTLNYSALQEPSLGGLTPDAMMQYAADMIQYESKMYNRRIFNQQEETNHMLSLSLNRSFFYEQLNVELSGAYNLTTEEQLFRGRLKWSISDAVSANVGCSYMLGPDESIYNMAGKTMNGVFLGLEVGF